MSKKNIKQLSKILMTLSLFSVVLSAIGYLAGDIWLASTQWLLVAGVLGLFGVYFNNTQ